MSVHRKSYHFIAPPSNSEAIAQAPKRGTLRESERVQRRKRSGKKSLQDMLFELQSDASQADYALRRIQALEGQIATIMGAIRPGARRMLIKQIPRLATFIR